MSLLRFDPSGSMDTQHGITQNQIDDLAGKLGELRSELVETAAQQHDIGAPPAHQQPLGSRFLRLPEEQLIAYEKYREKSELGRIFTLANGMHDEIDGVVVLGSGGASIGARAMMQACCDPYHNELTRALRGSKPRMYFGGNNVDNDASRSLLSRLATGGYGNIAAEERWVIIVISKSGSTLETSVALRQFLPSLERSLERSLGDPANKLLSRYVIPVTGETGQLRNLAAAIGCDEIFTLPSGVESRFSVLSPAGLLPAAMLGLDCMRLLVGAYEMSNHFKSADYHDNVVLQYVAVNHLLAQHRGKTTRVMSVWSKSLESLGLWHDQLLAESLGKAGGGITPLTTVNTRDLHSRGQLHQQGPNDKVFNNLIVESYRCDPLAVGRHGGNQDDLNDIADRTLPEMMDAAIRGTNQALHEDGRPTTDILLPHIDTHAVGQLFQMLMIATAIEARLIGVNPFDQPGTEQYKRNWNEHLGRG